MAATKIILNRSVTNKDGRHPVNLRVRDRFNTLTVATGFQASPEEWDVNRYKQGSGVRSFDVFRLDKGGVTKYTNRTANDELGAIQKKATDIITGYEQRGIDWTMQMFLDDYRTKRADNTIFYDYAMQHVEELRSNGQYSTATILLAALKDLKVFDPKFEKKDIRDLDKRFFDHYIKKRQNEGYQPNTISIWLRAIRAVLRKAIKDDVGSQATYPFGTDGVKIPSKSKTKTNNFLTLDGLALLASTPMEHYPQEEARHLFLFMTFACGMNYLDAAKLTNKNIRTEMLDDGTEDQVIRYVRSKTAHNKNTKDMVVYVDENVRRELDWFRENSPLIGDYLLPIIGKEQTPEKFGPYVAQRRKRYNRQLKKIAEKLGFGEALTDKNTGIGSYTARHSFAMAKRSSGVPDAIISEQLGHQDKRTAQAYFGQFGQAEMKRAQYIQLIGQQTEKMEKGREESPVRTRNKQN